MKTLIQKTTIAIIAMATLATTPVVGTGSAMAADKTLTGINECNFSLGGCTPQTAKAAEPMVVAGNGWKKAVVAGAVAGAVAGTITRGGGGYYTPRCWWKKRKYWRNGVLHVDRVKICR